MQKSLKKLSADTQASELKFWGKIQGTEKDYYIVEATIEEEGGDDEDVERGADFEAKGTGVNKFTYFVTHDSLSAWHKLPDLTPQEI